MEFTLQSPFELESQCYDQCFSRLAYARSMFMRRAHVCGVGVGPKQINGAIYPHLPCLIVYVTKKQQGADIDQRDYIPAVFRGVATDVIEVGSRRVPVHNEFDRRWLQFAEEDLVVNLG
jgi:hypothetical protein